MAKSKINWGLWSAIGTGLYFLWDMSQKNKAAATQAQQTSILSNLPTSIPGFETNPTNTGTHQTGDLSDILNPAKSNTQAANPVAMPNIQGMTADAIDALAAQMDALGMSVQSQALKNYAANMRAKGIETAPPSTWF